MGSYPAGASPYDALDMAGNVWERVMHWYSSSYYSSSPGEQPPGKLGDGKLSGSARGQLATTLTSKSGRRAVCPLDGPMNAQYSHVGFRCAAAPGG